MNKTQPITLLVCALGGEGGGVLTEWLVDIARHAGYAAQSTSIPGVARGVDQPFGQDAAAFAAEGADQQGDGLGLHAGCSARTMAPRKELKRRSCHFGFCTTSAR